MKVAIKNIEYYLPPTIEDSSTLKKDNPDWRMEDIEKKTGILTRHISYPDQTAADMAVLAVEKLFASGVDKETIGLLIFVTQSPDYVLPTTACILQDRLGLNKTCMAFDVNLGCSGFVYGIAIAGGLIESGLVQTGLVVCSETYTKYIDKSDRTCRPIFSDGASATLMTACDTHALGPFEMGTDGSGHQNLIVSAGGARKKGSGVPNLTMDGAQVFMFTMDMVPKCVNALLKKADKTIEDIDLFVFHQASKLVMDNIVRRLGLPEPKFFTNYSRIGNTVSAALPIALKDAVDEKRLKPGDLVMLVGFGVGYSWGGCLVQWDSVI
jgi:3-oxoacyl-[acyl-carrier-protein] synthase III